MVTLKYVSNFRRTLEMPLMNCENNIDLDCSKNCSVVVNDANQAKFSITDTKTYVQIVTLSTQDNAKLLEQLKSGFKRTINWNKYQSKILNERPNQYLDYLIDPSFQGVNRLLSFKNEAQRYYFLTVEIKNYVMSDGQNFLDQPIRNISRTYDNI